MSHEMARFLAYGVVVLFASIITYTEIVFRVKMARIAKQK